jgi:hypothetical protein
MVGKHEEKTQLLLLLLLLLLKALQLQRSFGLPNEFFPLGAVFDAEKTQLGRPKYRWKDSMKMDLQELEWSTCIGLIWLRIGVTWRVRVKNRQL